MGPGAASRQPMPAAPPGRAAAGAGVAAAPAGRLEMLRRRADFLACARGRRVHMPAFVMQARRRGAESGQEGDTSDAGPPRVGFTASRKVGRAVARNRARRRLREAARRVIPAKGRPGWDYVLIARHGVTAAHPFPALVADLEKALARLHGEDGQPAGRGSGGPRG